MTPNDMLWFKQCLASGLVEPPFLEVGSARVLGATHNLCDIARESSITPSIGADLVQGDGVDLVIDFSAPDFQPPSHYQTVAIFNVLEHTFDPVCVLRNVLKCVQPGGVLLVLTPCVWPIHNWPGDFNRLLPDWYRAFASVSNINIIEDKFCWLSPFGIDVIDGPNTELPSFISRRHACPTFKYWRSRLVHKVFDTYGRASSPFTHSAIAAAFAIPKS